MAYPDDAAPDPSTWFANQSIDGPTMKQNLTDPLNAIRARLPRTAIGTVTISAGNSQNTANVSFPTGLSGPPTILNVVVNDGSRNVSANPGTPTAANVPVHVFTTAGNSVGSSAVAFSVTVVFAGI